MKAEVTQLLRRAHDGDPRASEQLLATLSRELHGIAKGAMARESDGHTLQPTALVNEAWLRLFPDGRAPDWSNRKHFLASASRAMRRVLVDHARERGARKRGDGMRPEPIDLWIDVLEESVPDVLVLHEALEQLAEVDEELARLVELRFFAGLSILETARVLEVSESSVERGWRTARAWLRGRLGES